jgi:glutaminase
VHFTDNVGKTLTFKILNNDLTIWLQRSVNQSSVDTNHRNKGVAFMSDT